jgi:hypothetical protein
MRPPAPPHTHTLQALLWKSSFFSLEVRKGAPKRRMKNVQCLSKCNFRNFRRDLEQWRKSSSESTYLPRRNYGGNPEEIRRYGGNTEEIRR